MKTFNILTSFSGLSDLQKEIALRAFNSLLEGLTPKHKKKIALLIIGEPSCSQSIAQQFVKDQPTNPIDYISRDELTEAHFEQAEIYLCLGYSQKNKFEKMALSYGLPILGYESLKSKISLDYSCSILIKKQSPELTVGTITHFMRMLFFDPEATKMLSKGAVSKFDQLFGYPMPPQQLAVA